MAGSRPNPRADVLDRLEVAADLRTQRYLQLLVQINGWPPLPDLTPHFRMVHPGAEDPPLLKR